MGPRKPMEARNLISSYQHPLVIHTQLQKEIDAGQIWGPFHYRPMPSLRCYGLGVVPKKDNKWRMILHLSAPTDASINDYISKDAYSLQYTGVDDAVSMLVSLGAGAPMAKVDLKSAFRMIPVRPQDWELLGLRWQGNYYFDTCLPFGLRSAPYLFNQYAEALQWILLWPLTTHTLPGRLLSGRPSGE